MYAVCNRTISNPFFTKLSSDSAAPPNNANRDATKLSEYPNIEVLPLQLSAAELKASHWKFLMGAVGNQATYIRQLMRVMKVMRDNITIEGLRAGIDTLSVPDHLKELARMRLDLASEYINDGSSLSDVVRPGRLIVVDLRDEFIEKDDPAVHRDRVTLITLSCAFCLTQTS